MTNLQKKNELHDKQSVPIQYENHPEEFIETYNPTQYSRTPKADDRERQLRTRMSHFRYCKTHANRLEDYCVDHDVLCCTECTAGGHKGCLNIRPAEQEADDVFQSKLYVDLGNKLKDIIKALTNTEVKSSSETTNSQESSKTARATSKNDKPNDTRLTAELCDLLTQANELNELFEFVHKNGSTVEAFFFIHSCKNDIERLGVKSKASKKLSIKRHKPGDSVLAFVGIKSQSPESFQIFKPCDLPSSKTSTFPPKEFLSKSAPISDQLPSLNEPNQAPFVTFNKDLDFRGVKLCSIYGMAITENNFLVLSDSNFHRIIVFDDSDIFKHEIEFRYDPWDIAALDNTQTVVVSSTDEQILQFIDIDRKCVVRETKQKHCDMAGISNGNKVILVGSEDKVRILDQKGKQTGTIKGIPGRFNYIHICENGNVILVHGHEISAVTQSGAIIFHYSSPDLLSPGKPGTDYDGNVYIPGLFTHNIHRLTADGTFVDSILNENDGIHFPTAVCFDVKRTKLYIANNSGNSVKVFTLNKEWKA